MAFEVRMPRLTYEMQEGQLLTWLKQDGDSVTAGEPLLEVETDKAAATVEAEASGVLRSIRFPAGSVVPIGEVLAFIAETGEAVAESDLPPALPRPVADESVQSAKSPAGVEASAAERTAISVERPLASPIAKRLAREYGVDLARIKGSGSGGRVLERDVLNAAWAAATPMSAEPFVDRELTRLQRVTGERLAEVQRTVPQFVLEVEVDVSAAKALRETLRQSNGAAVSYTTIFARAVALALREQPEMNSSFVDGKRREYRQINLGIAVATTEGLTVPVVPKADTLSLAELDGYVEALVVRARGGTLRGEDLSGGTFTISNLGMFGVDAFQAIVNPPQVGILAVGRVRESVVARGGLIGVAPLSVLRLTVDHRVVDGTAGARFLTRVREIVEDSRALV